MTPQEINQLAAARMIAGTLHNALKEAVGQMDDRWEPGLVKRFNDALEHNEPAVLAVLNDANREARVRALTGAAKDVVECARGTEDEELVAAITKLEQASKAM